MSDCKEDLIDSRATALLDSLPLATPNNNDNDNHNNSKCQCSNCPQKRVIDAISDDLNKFYLLLDKRIKELEKKAVQGKMPSGALIQNRNDQIARRLIEQGERKKVLSQKEVAELWGVERSRVSQLRHHIDADSRLMVRYSSRNRSQYKWYVTLRKYDKGV